MNRRIGLIGPKFFGYAEAIKDELIRKNYKCFFYDELSSNSIIFKILIRLNISFLTKNQIYDYHREILLDILKKKLTDIILISTESIDSNFVDFLRKRSINVYLYMWDSLERKTKCKAIISAVNSVASFDPLDCNLYNFSYIPLFAETCFDKKISKCFAQRSSNIIFSGTLHSRRAFWLFKIMRKLKHTDFEAKLLIYCPSKIIFLIKSVVNPYILFFLTRLSTKKFTKFDISESFNSSRFVLDIHHKNQRGLTSRTFEGLLSGAYLISFNPTIKHLPFELNSRVIFLEDPCFINDELLSRYSGLPLVTLTHQQKYYLSIERFVEDFINIFKLN